MATVSELRVLFRVVDLASREMATIERNFRRMESAAVRANIAQARTADLAARASLDQARATLAVQQAASATARATEANAIAQARAALVTATATKARDDALANSALARQRLENTLADSISRRKIATEAIAVAEMNLEAVAKSNTATDLQYARAELQLLRAEEARASAERAINYQRAQLSRQQISSAQNLALVTQRGAVQQMAANAAVANSVSQLAIANSSGYIKVQATQLQAQRSAAALTNQNVNLTKSMTGVATMAPLMRAGIIGAAAAAVGLTAAVTYMGVSFNAMREQATAAFGGLLRSAPLAASFMEELFEWTRRTALGFDFAIRSAAEFIARGVELRNVIPYMDAIANAAAALPRPMEESVQRISYAIGQISQSARLHSQDIRQLTEAGINAWGYLREATGATIDQMQDDADKFGLTGQRVTQIILDGMRRDFGGMLEIQRNTFRGQLSVARRNVQELAGIFTEDIFKDFRTALIELNNIMADPGVQSAVRQWGQAIGVVFDALTLSVEGTTFAIEKLIDIIPKIPQVSLPGGGKVGLEEILLRTFPVTAPFANVGYLPTDLRRLGLIGGGQRGTPEAQLGRLGGQLANLQERRQTLETQLGGRGGLAAASLRRELDETNNAIRRTESEVEKLKTQIEATGDTSSSAARKVETAAMAMQRLYDEAATGAEGVRESLKELFGQRTRELVEAELAIAEYNLSTMVERGNLEGELRNLEDAARAASDAAQRQAQAIDDQITAIEREIAARDRAEARIDLIERSKISREEAALRKFEVEERRIERAGLVRATRTGEREDRAAAQRELRRFDLEEANRRRQILEEQERAARDLERFDRETAERARIQGLQDQRDSITRAAEAQQRQYDLQREGVERQLSMMDQEVERRQKVRDTLQAELDIAQLFAEKNDAQLKSQDDVITKAYDLAGQLKKLTDRVMELDKAMLDSQKALKEELLRVETGREQQLLEQLYGGPRQHGGRVDPRHWYWVGERGPEPFIPNTNGTILPNSITNNNRRVVNLAPINITIQGQPKDALEVLLQGF